MADVPGKLRATSWTRVLTVAAILGVLGVGAYFAISRGIFASTATGCTLNVTQFNTQAGNAGASLSWNTAYLIKQAKYDELIRSPKSTRPVASEYTTSVSGKGIASNTNSDLGNIYFYSQYMAISGSTQSLRPFFSNAINCSGGQKYNVTFDFAKPSAVATLQTASATQPTTPGATGGASTTVCLKIIKDNTFTSMVRSEAITLGFIDSSGKTVDATKYTVATDAECQTANNTSATARCVNYTRGWLLFTKEADGSWVSGSNTLTESEMSKLTPDSTKCATTAPAASTSGTEDKASKDTAATTSGTKDKASKDAAASTPASDTPNLQAPVLGLGNFPVGSGQINLTARRYSQGQSGSVAVGGVNFSIRIYTNAKTVTEANNAAAANKASSKQNATSTQGSTKDGTANQTTSTGAANSTTNSTTNKSGSSGTTGSTTPSPDPPASSTFPASQDEIKTNDGSGPPQDPVSSMSISKIKTALYNLFGLNNAVAQTVPTNPTDKNKAAKTDTSATASSPGKIYSTDTTSNSSIKPTGGNLFSTSKSSKDYTGAVLDVAGDVSGTVLDVLGSKSDEKPVYNNPVPQSVDQIYATMKGYKAYTFTGTIPDNGTSSSVHLVNLPAGRYVITLSKSGFRSVKYSFTLSGTNTLNANVNIRPNKGAEPPAIATKDIQRVGGQADIYWTQMGSAKYQYLPQCPWYGWQKYSSTDGAQPICQEPPYDSENQPSLSIEEMIALQYQGGWAGQLNRCLSLKLPNLSKTEGGILGAITVGLIANQSGASDLGTALAGVGGYVIGSNLLEGSSMNLDLLGGCIPDLNNYPQPQCALCGALDETPNGMPSPVKDLCPPGCYQNGLFSLMKGLTL